MPMKNTKEAKDRNAPIDENQFQ